MRPFVLPCLAVGFVACLAYALHRRSTRRAADLEAHRANERALAAGWEADRARRIPVQHPDAAFRVGLSADDQVAFDVIAAAEDPDLNAGLSIFDHDEGLES